MVINKYINEIKTFICLNNILFMSAVLMPLSLITGAFFSNFFASVVSIVFLTISIKKKLFSYYNNVFFLIFISFCIFLIISSLLSDFKLFSLKSSLLYFRHGLFALGICYCCINFPNFKKYFFYSLVISFILITITGFYEFINHKNIYGNEVDLYRLSMFTNGKWIVGAYIVRTLPIAFALLLYISKENDIKLPIKIFYLILFILSILLVVLSGERTALGITIVLLVIIISLSTDFKKIRLLILISTVILMVYSINYNENLKTRIIGHTYSQLGFNPDTLGYKKNTLIAFSPVHQEYFQEAINMYKSAPIIGKGPNTFRKYCDNIDYNVGVYCSTHPHNFYIQLIAETGTIGLLYILYIFIITSWIIFKQFLFKLKIINTKLTTYRLIILSSLFSLLWPIAPTLNFFNSWNSITLFLIAGFILAEYLLLDKKLNTIKNISN